MQRSYQEHGRPFLFCAALTLATLLFVALLWRTGLLQEAELSVYDRLISVRADPQAHDPRIVLILFDEEDINTYDYPLHDKTLAALLEKIESGRPAAIGIDLYRDLPVPRDASELSVLNQTFARFQNIIGIFLFNDDPKTSAQQPFAVPPAPALRGDLNRCGFNDIPIDYKTVRRGFLFKPASNQYASFANLLAQTYLANVKNIYPEADGDSMRLGRTTFHRFRATDGGYIHGEDDGTQILLDFRGPAAFDQYNVRAVLQKIDAATFRDKIVIIGGGSDTANDNFSTPLSAHRNRLVFGALLHAQIVNQLLRAALDGDRPTATFRLLGNSFWIAAWCLLGAITGYFFRSYIHYGLATAGGLALLVGLVTLLFLRGWWLPLVAPALAFGLSSVAVKSYLAYFGEQQRNRLMNLFSRHVAPEVADLLWSQRDKFLNGNRPAAQRLTATVLFSDLSNFTTLSQAMEPQELMDWINQCLGALAVHVGKNRGMINKFIGDAIMALFGVPVPRTTEAEIRRDAVNAVSCALDMGAELRRLNEVWHRQGRETVRMRIGIYTGELMAGVLGSEDRLEYTVIGDSVNTAARLESLDKENKLSKGVAEECRILIGEKTHQLIRDQFETEALESQVLKGQKDYSSVYKVLARKSPVSVN